MRRARVTIAVFAGTLAPRYHEESLVRRVSVKACGSRKDDVDLYMRVPLCGPAVGSMRVAHRQAPSPGRLLALVPLRQRVLAAAMTALRLAACLVASAILTLVNVHGLSR
jgi:hypothetical protein